MPAKRVNSPPSRETARKTARGASASANPGGRGRGRGGGRGRGKGDADDANASSPRSLQLPTDGDVNAGPEKAGGAGAAQQFRRISHREHVLLRPGMYVGSIVPDPCDVWLYDPNTRRMVKRRISYVPAFLKIFDEILMNAVDHAVTTRDRKTRQGEQDVQTVRNIRVSIDKASGEVEVVNDGEGIPVVQHPDGVYVPEMAFGHLLTSTNYDDESTTERIVGGQNGIGAKACNIFSRRFEVETVDRHRRVAYRQVFEANMSVTHPPSVTRCTKKPYTRVAFLPDYARFGMGEGMTDDMHALLVKRVYDAAAVTDADVNVFLNGERIEYRTFERYIDLYVGPRPSAAAAKAAAGGKAAEGGSDSSAASTPRVGSADGGSAGERVYERINDWWEVAAACSDGNGLQQVSFVNGVCTLRGGRHVDHIVNQIARKVADTLKSKRATAAALGDGGVKPQFIKDNLFVFVKATIPNPAFDSQSKETLTTPASQFGGRDRSELSQTFIDKLCRTGLVDRVVRLNEATMDRSMKRTDGRQQTSVTGIPKLDDANWAGGAKSRHCTLILTEGDSAKTMAIAGLTQAGRDRFGVFPLRGKIMNVCDMQASRIAANQEIAHLKKILGLESGREYATTDGLRYGKIMVMTDQDVDGSHIKGLLFNLFHALWPSLLRADGFLTSLLTPIVKARRRGQPTLQFYSLADYEAWKAQNANGRGWDIKYYKGLGTSTREEAKEYFRELKVTTYKWRGDVSGAALDLAFNKARADDRKAWLLSYDKTKSLDYGAREVAFEDFVDRDLIHFSNYDIVRSIPSVCDGFKVSQRKIMYGCLKRGLTKQQVKVAQLAGYVAENSAYHHGEVSLNATIVGMAQDFVGANNVNLLQPVGQFGSRIQGGKDSAAPRYIHTLLHPLALAIFRAEDTPVLTFLDDDGQQVEPEFYLPVVPMVLVNGAMGIGTGFSTNVPCFDPRAVIRVLREMLDGQTEAEALSPLRPWYRGFTGTVEEIDADKFVSRGRWQRVKPAEVHVSELPLGYWTEDFKTVVDGLRQSLPELRDARHNHSDTTVSCTLVFANAAAVDAMLREEEERPHGTGAGARPVRMTRLEKELKLVGSARQLSTNNMYLFNHEGRIQKYEDAHAIVREYFGVRLAAYDMRKRVMLADLRRRVEVLENKIRFLDAVISGAIVVHRRDKADLERELADAAYLKVEDSYEYLLRIPLYALTVDKRRELDDQARDLRAAIARIDAMTERDMWREDLDVFERRLDEDDARRSKQARVDAGYADADADAWDDGDGAAGGEEDAAV